MTDPARTTLTLVERLTQAANDLVIAQRDWHQIAYLPELQRRQQLTIDVLREAADALRQTPATPDDLRELEAEFTQAHARAKDEAGELASKANYSRATIRAGAYAFAALTVKRFIERAALRARPDAPPSGLAQFCQSEGPRGETICMLPLGHDGPCGWERGETIVAARLRAVWETIDSLQDGGWLTPTDADRIRATLPAVGERPDAPPDASRLCARCRHPFYSHVAPGVCAERLEADPNQFCCCEEFLEIANAEHAHR